MTLDAERILKLVNDWVWVPEDAVEIRTQEFHLVAFPAHFADPTQCLRIDSSRPADELVDDVLASARRLGRDRVTFFEISDATRPADLERVLRCRGAEQVEELAVLALDLSAGPPDLDAPDDVVIRPVVDLDTLRDHDVVSTEVFGGTPMTDCQLVDEIARLEREEGERYVAYLADEPVGAGGSTYADDAVRLWGGAVRSAYRHGGVYRALLAHRLAVAASAGARLALVQGRVDSSAPVLTRAGFERFGTRRSLRLPVDR